jgi:hypothetical protein
MQFGNTEGNSTQREVGAEVQLGGSLNLIYMYFPQNSEPWARSVTLAHGQNALQHNTITTITRMTIE